MSQTVQLSRLIDGELPFTLNLPDGVYHVLQDGQPYAIQLLQHHVMAPIRDGQMFVGARDRVASELGDAWAESFKYELRTRVQRVDVVEVPVCELGEPTEEEVLDNLKYHILLDTHDFDGKPEELTALAVRTLAAYDEPTRLRLREDKSLRMAIARVFDREDGGRFCTALSRLIRQYAITFDDPFVEDVMPQHFANTLFGGLRIAFSCNGQHLAQHKDAGGRFPFILRRPWLQHPEDQVTAFRAALVSGGEVDPVAHLMARAKALFVRGDYRSAVIEAHAALDLCLTRKLREGYGRGGKSDAEVGVILKAEIRFKKRAGEMLKSAVGKTAAELDAPLWNRIVATHHVLRNEVVHQDREPNQQDAMSAVNDMASLNALITST